MTIIRIRKRPEVATILYIEDNEDNLYTQPIDFEHLVAAIDEHLTGTAAG